MSQSVAPAIGARAYRAAADPASQLARATNEFERLYYSHTGRAVRKWHHYLEVYERHIGRFIAERQTRGETGPVRLLELGIASGGSLQLWRKYLGSEAIIFGIDIRPECDGAAGDAAETRIGSQADPGFLQAVVSEMGGVDVVVDDGSHVASHQRASFDTLFPMVSPYGLYFCEDLHASYWPKFKGGLKRPGTFCEMFKDMVDWLHAWYIPPPQRERHQFTDAYDFSTCVFGIAMYDSMAVIEKRPKGRPFHSAMPRLRMEPSRDR